MAALNSRAMGRPISLFFLSVFKNPPADIILMYSDAGGGKHHTSKGPVIRKLKWTTVSSPLIKPIISVKAGKTMSYSKEENSLYREHV